MFCAHLRRTCNLLFLDGMSYIYQLNLSGDQYLLKHSRCCHFAAKVGESYSKTSDIGKYLDSLFHAYNLVVVVAPTIINEDCGLSQDLSRSYWSIYYVKEPELHKCTGQRLCPVRFTGQPGGLCESEPI